MSHKPVFEVKLQVHESNARDYRVFITSLRARLRNNTIEHVQVLPPQEGSTPRLFDVVLTADRGDVRLRIQQDNLYIVGYQARDTWYEINNNAMIHLIPSASWLNFDARYRTLEDTSRRARRDMNLNQMVLNGAVNRLLPEAGAPDMEAQAHSVLVFAQMISESLRFTYIENEIVNHYFADTDEVIRGRIARMQNSWGNYSEEIQRHAIDNLVSLPQGGVIQELGINDWPGLIAILGLLLYWGPLTNSRILRDVVVAPTEGKALILHGRRLVEIFSVRILNIDNENPGDLYGTIKATDGLWSSYIFKRNSSHYQSIYPGHDATLTGPSRVISAAGEFVIDFDLKDYDADASPDDEISRGKIVWNPYDFTNVFNTEKTEIIPGKYGSAALNYVVMKNAAEAEVAVILINGDDEDPADVCGTVEAHNTSYEKEIKLFNEPSPSYEQVRPGRPIPLLRYALAVPMDATLKIRAHLWDYDTLSSNDEIANGTAEFKPEILRSASTRLKGQYGEIEVRVSWL